MFIAVIIGTAILIYFLNKSQDETEPVEPMPVVTNDPSEETIPGDPLSEI